MNRQQKRTNTNPSLPLPMQYPSPKRVIDRKKTKPNPTGKGHVIKKRRDK